ncbi:MAG: hypothetical protein EXS37_14650 [Opitutus sp.]|nr:hypothetical protein [Opitutus sp.]
MKLQRPGWMAPRKTLSRISVRRWMRIWWVVVLLGGFATRAAAQSYPGHWQARWIWDDGVATPYHHFLMARKTFSLPGAPARASLKITVSDRYLLYVNGEYVGRGPARSDPRFVSFDPYDLGVRLRPGENTIAILAYHYGTINGYTRDARAGIFAQLELQEAGGAIRIVGTDGSWKVRPAKAWSKEATRINDGIGISEVYDARVDPADWIRPGFDDSTWSPANTKLESARGAVAWSYLEPRQTPLLRETEIFPRRVVQRGEVTELHVEANAVPDLLSRESHHELAHATIVGADDLLAADGRFARLTGGSVRSETAVGPRRAPFVVVDFGRPIFGFPRVRLRAAAGKVVDLAYGTRLLNEKDAALLAPRGRSVSRLNDPATELVGRLDLSYMPAARLGDRYITRDGNQVWQVFQPRPIRYLMIVGRDADTAIEVDSVSVVALEYPAERRGQFECSDPLLTKLWKACVDTTYLHLEDTLVCDAVRERRPWTGDGAHGLLGIFAGYGDLALSDWYFRLVARGQLPDGMLRMSYPGREHALSGSTSRPATDNHLYVPHPNAGIVTMPSAENPLNIPQFAFIYAIQLGEHHRLYGKTKLIADLFPVLVRLAEWCERHSDETGLLYGLPNWNFFDWVRTDMRGANLETNAIFYQTLLELAAFADDLGRPTEATTWRARARVVHDAIRRLHWNPERGLFAAGYFEGRQSEVFTETGNGLALLFGIAAGGQIQQIVDRLGRDGTEMSRSTPLYFNYTLEGLMRVGAVDTAAALMRSRYRDMVNTSDFPTVWEFWSPNHRQNQQGQQGVQIASPIHSGSVGPAWVLSKHILGVHPIGPGFRSCRIAPQPGNLDHARGVVPTGRGDVEVAWRRSAGEFTLEVNLPGNLETEILLPVLWDGAVKLTQDGKEVRAAGFVPDAQAKGFTPTDRRIVVSVNGGKHRFELTNR